MSKAVVLDASALLCLLHGEAGAERVADALPRAVIGAANLAEVVTKLRERGLSAEEVAEALVGSTLMFVLSHPPKPMPQVICGLSRGLMAFPSATGPALRSPRNLALPPSLPIRPGLALRLA